MPTSVKYSARAASAIGFLKSSQNDIDIFVEDTTNRNMWIAYLQKHLTKSINFNSVTMLGGREVVVEACRINVSSRPSLFIIDSDMDILLGQPKPKLKNLYQVPAYCIENMLIEDAALADIATSFKIEMSTHQALALYSTSKFLSENQSALRLLFVAYAISSIITPEQKTISNPCSDFYIDQKLGVKICHRKALSRSLSILRQARKEDKNAFFQLFRIVKVNSRKFDIKHYCSGKDYLLPPIHIGACKAFGFKGNLDQLKVSLAKSPHIKKDRRLASAITRSLNSKAA